MVIARPSLLVANSRHKTFLHIMVDWSQRQLMGVAFFIYVKIEEVVCFSFSERDSTSEKKASTLPPRVLVQ